MEIWVPWELNFKSLDSLQWIYSLYFFFVKAISSSSPYTWRFCISTVKWNNRNIFNYWLFIFWLLQDLSCLQFMMRGRMMMAFSMLHTVGKTHLGDTYNSLQLPALSPCLLLSSSVSQHIDCLCYCLCQIYAKLRL